MPYLFKCCESFQRVTIIYQDETLMIRRRLEMLADLLISVDTMAAIEPDTIVSVGSMIKEILRHQSIIDHLLFDRPLGDDVHDEEVRFEKKRLKGSHKEVS